MVKIAYRYNNEKGQVEFIVDYLSSSCINVNLLDALQKVGIKYKTASFISANFTADFKQCSSSYKV